MSGSDSEDDDVRGGCGLQSTVGGDLRNIQRYRQLHIHGVSQTELVASRPRAEEKIGHRVALDRGSDEFAKLRLDTVGLEFASSVQSPQRGESFDHLAGGCS